MRKFKSIRHARQLLAAHFKSKATFNSAAIAFPPTRIALPAIAPSIPGAMRPVLPLWVDLNWFGGCAATALAI
jgi:hypothetical protein